MTQLVFISLFLGLVSGSGMVELRATPDVKAVRLILGDQEIGFLQEQPWKAMVDFGAALEPRALVAVGYDDRGNEIARTSQVIGLPRPSAEVQIVVQRDGDIPNAVTLIPTHLQFLKVRNAVVNLDGSKLRMEKLTAKLPPLLPGQTHVIDAAVTFTDGVVARCELVLQGGFSDSTGTELTAIAVTRPETARMASLDDCFTYGDDTLRTAAVDRDVDAFVALVQDPDPADVQSVVLPMLRGLAGRAGRADRERFREEMRMDEGTHAAIIWPVTETYTSRGQPPSFLFVNSYDGDAHDRGMISFMASRPRRSDLYDQPLRFADAVAVAGLRAVQSPRRRAVILLLSTKPDRSLHTPAEVRRYLATIGVPLFVWSLHGPRPDLAESWGRVDDVSSRRGLQVAVQRLRELLASQSIVWLAADPLTSIGAEPKTACRAETFSQIARKGERPDP